MYGGSLALPTEEELRALLTTQGATYVKSARVVDQTIFLVVDAQRVAATAHDDHQTSKRQLAALGRMLQDQFSTDVQISQESDEESARIQQVLEGILRRRFAESVSEVNVALLGAETASVWVDSEAVTDSALADQIYRATRDALELLNLPESSIYVQTPVVAEPTLLAILRAVKINAPVRIEQLSNALSAEFGIPSVQWLASKLDLARKHGLVIRDQDEYFHLTESGLTTVPSGRGRNSSDVARALILSKRKWR